MAKSKFEYVKAFEVDDRLLPNCYILVRLDGRGFSKFTKQHEFAKPNDLRGVELMNHCAKCLLCDFPDVLVAIGHSDEYSFILRKEAELWSRRASKLQSSFASYFSSLFVFHWPVYFPDLPLLYPPMFDGRTVLYPSVQNVRDYLSWRQADCHINNLYNTCFWSLVLQSSLSEAEAHRRLSATNSAQKNEMLFRDYGVNYNSLPPIFRKGTVLARHAPLITVHNPKTGEQTTRPGKKKITVEWHQDIITDPQFWLLYCPQLFLPTETNPSSSASNPSLPSSSSSSSLS